MSDLPSLDYGHDPGARRDVPASPVPKLLGSNLPTAESEPYLIRDTLARLEGEVVSLLNDSTKRRVDLRVDHEQSLSPVLKIPPELMGDIFLHSLPHEWESRHGHGEGALYRHRRAVLLPGQVCSLWRQISSTTPKLWSKISLCLIIHEPELDANLETWMMETYLIRSANTGLNIQLLGESNGSYSELRKTMVPQLLTHAHRWQDLILDLVDSWTLDTLHKYWGLMSSLQRFSILPGACWNEPIILATPQLRTLNLQLWSTLWLPMIKSLPWSQLTEVHLSGAVHTISACLGYLQSAPNLWTLVLSCYRHKPFPSTPMFHSQLRVLHISSSDGSALSYLTLPSLREIVVTSYTWPHAAFISLMSRSSCRLESFTARCSRPMLEEELVECLQLTPALSELAILGATLCKDSQIAEAILRRLTLCSPGDDGQIMDEPCLVPELKKIDLKFGVNLDLDVLLDMLRSRQQLHPGDLQLKSVPLELIRLRPTLNVMDKATWKTARTALSTVERWIENGSDVEMLDSNGDQQSLKSLIPLEE